MGISICIPTYNRLAHLKELLNSIFDGFGEYPYEIIVADGGSTDGTIEYLKGLENVTLIEQGKLMGAVKAFNECFKLAKFDYILWPADDFIIFPEIIIKGCKMMDEYEDVGIVAPKELEPTYGLPGVELIFRLVLSKTHIFRTSALKKINYFDENFRLYVVDDDSCMGILSLGYSIAFTREIGIIHKRIKDESRNKNRKIEEKIHIEEMEYFKKKWFSFNSKIEDELSIFKKIKWNILTLLSRATYSFKICNYFPKKLRKFVFAIYDKMLENCVNFPDERFKNSKDFYLVQRIPLKIIK